LGQTNSKCIKERAPEKIIKRGRKQTGEMVVKGDTHGTKTGNKVEGTSWLPIIPSMWKTKPTY